jgi:RNA polymerase sigma factor (TIGR02999 family)
MPSAPSQITGLLRRWAEGDVSAFDQLVPIVYDRLRQLARQRLRSDPGATLDSTGLVHEVYLKLADAPHSNLRDRSHFLALASRVMRNLLSDHARSRRAAKRGGGVAPLPLVEEVAWMSDDDLDAVTALDDALSRLEALDPRQSRVLEQRYFGGLSLEETSLALGVSLATVKRELRSARAWLAAELAGEQVV